ncbi:chemotaxis response regulator protein-glutamate methylesterase [Sphaerotilus sp.]|uniref:protein-glutamate methylesterase/protein-glutamine glutaminase n=1 Tax=Sphaerotilus sp. TaxID=2093942 RepID=UPI002ACEB01E|nr:chemotaxis response regulator protein-glutamate methylesterase [Sphaerotilus sp.]
MSYPPLRTALSAASGLPLRVLVVDDSAAARAMLCAILARQPDMVCVGQAVDASQAREMIRGLDPDVVTLDMVMPGMDGLDFLERLMRLRPTPVVVVAAPTRQHQTTVLRAAALGAVAFVDKPLPGGAGAVEGFEQRLVACLREAVRGRSVRRAVGHAEPSVATVTGGGRLIAIGASTGGTEATPRLLARLSNAVPPVLIVQHMPAGFSARYAARLNTLGPLTVSEACDGEPLQAGHAYVAPGGLHLSVERGSTGGYVARVSEGEPVQRHRPSVDVLFRSVAKVAGDRAIGIMLTGMGGDGAQAMRLLRDAGAYNLAQDEATSAIFGMPREAIRAGACQEVLPLDAIGPRVMALLRPETSPAGR